MYCRQQFLVLFLEQSTSLSDKTIRYGLTAFGYAHRAVLGQHSENKMGAILEEGSLLLLCHFAPRAKISKSSVNTAQKVFN